MTSTKDYKYSELKNINFTLTSFTPIAAPKFVPIPSINNPDVGVENMAMNYFAEYEKTRKDLKEYLDSKREREIRKQEAFTKKLVPEKTTDSNSDSSAHLKTSSKPDLSEFDSITDKESSSPSKVDFKLLKEIMGLKDVTIQSNPIAAMSNHGLSKPIPAAKPASITSQSSSLVSIGSFHQRTPSGSSPPKIQTPSPSKKDYISRLPGLTQTRESLRLMGFHDKNIGIGLSLYRTDQELLDFLFLAQEFDTSFLDVFWKTEITNIPELLKTISSLCEMGFSVSQVTNSLWKNNLKKDEALEFLLHGS
jgi:hypothetical protein